MEEYVEASTFTTAHPGVVCKICGRKGALCHMAHGQDDCTGGPRPPLPSIKRGEVPARRKVRLMPAAPRGHTRHPYVPIQEVGELVFGLFLR
jgi:hypothetical protein